MLDGRPTIVSIVAGHGEVASVPILIRRIATEVNPSAIIHCPRPIRAHQYGFTDTASERRKYVELARIHAGPRGAILVLIDSEGALPCHLGPRLLDEVRTLAGACEVGVVLAHQEYESWFLAAASSLSQAGLLKAGLDDHPNPEGLRDAKGWLSDNMADHRRKYRPPDHQPGFTARFDMQAARRAGSFDKCYREVERLVRAVTGQA